jgi:hypothetical protein
MSDDRPYVRPLLTLSEALHIVAICRVYAMQDAVVQAGATELLAAADEIIDEFPEEADRVTREILARAELGKIDLDD